MNLKQFKPVHWIYNLLNYKALRHNRAAYKKYNVHKSLIASISSKDFPDKESKAWLDTGDSQLLAPQKQHFTAFSPAIQEQIKNWSRDGYLILEKFFDSTTCDAVNAEIEKLQQAGRLHFTYGNKLMFANKKSKLVKGVAGDEQLKKVL